MKSVSEARGVVIIEGHVQGLANARSLGREGIPVIVVSEYDCLAHYSKYCRKFFRCPGYLTDTFIDFLISLAKSEELRNWVLLPSNDHAVFNISSNSERLSDHYRIISPSKGLLGQIYDKEKLIRLCLESDIPVPESWFPSDEKDITVSQLRFPLLIKGKNGLTFYRKMGKKAFLANDRQGLMDLLSIMGQRIPLADSFLQELVPLEKNKTVSFTGFSVEGEIKAFWMGVKIREHPVHFGTATYSKSINVPGLQKIAERLIKKLGFTGVCEIEFLQDPRDNTYKLIEVNPRTWLWVGMAIKDGVNYPVMVFNYLNGLEVNYPTSYHPNSEWIHYLTDIPYSLLGLIRGHYSPAEIFRSYLRFPSPAVLDLSDPLPSLAEFALLPQFIFKR